MKHLKKVKKDSDSGYFFLLGPFVAGFGMLILAGSLILGFVTFLITSISCFYCYQKTKKLHF